MPKPTTRKKPTTVRDRLNAAARRAVPAADAAARTPLWEGPGGPGPNGGVTQSLLGRYLSDGERFRVQYVEGWNPPDHFEPRLEFGNMWHACEEALASGQGVVKGNGLGLDEYWQVALQAYVTDLCRRYQADRPEIILWAEKCAALFPIYVDHWKDHPDVEARTPLEQEGTFDVIYRLPSGRTVRLRGKRDSVDLVGKGRAARIWLQENKTKSGIDSAALTRQLSFDLQSQFYLVSLREGLARPDCPVPLATAGKTCPIAGVRYNVIKRPGHKSAASMLEKVGVDMRNGRSGEWFARWNVEVSDADVARFRRECLDPLLENLCDDWEWWDWCFRTKTWKDDGSGPIDQFAWTERAAAFPKHVRRHYRMPYGVYSPLTEGGTGEVDEYISSGSTAGLRRKTKLFEELAK